MINKGEIKMTDNTQAVKTRPHSGYAGTKKRMPDLLKLSFDELRQERNNMWRRVKQLPQSIQYKMDNDPHFTLADAQLLISDYIWQYRATMKAASIVKTRAKLEMLEGK